ncbi:c-type cytochrome [Cloacibacterium sp.]|uniref:c-type cytochrome n=1 Tax=Cloacibacterium sp. TaxID=1913682 RepID=UPI0039E4A4DC
MKIYKIYVLIFLGLIVIFNIYNTSIYTSQSNFGNVKFSEKAIKGETLWLQNNCNACHQLYGLGGYLGPDLTNVCSTPNKSDEYLKVMMISGLRSMPKFNFSPEEQAQLLQFLKEVDKSGYFPNKGAKIKPEGWVELQYKSINNEKK